MGSFQSNIYRNLKAAFYTLGCKLNFAETSTIGKIMSERGIKEAAKGETPDVCILNTCSVTQMADKKARSLIRRIRRDFPETLLIVTGCYAQLKPNELTSIEGIDAIIGSQDKLKIPEIIDGLISKREDKPNPLILTSDFRDINSFSPSCARGDRTRFFLKVQDGCDYFCTYCTIPFARGKSRSGLISEMVNLAGNVAEQGGREIVITGVNVGDFGKNTGESFFDLIRSLDKIKGIERYRISSIEPNLLTDDIIKWVANESRAFMPHFHIPLQSGSDRVLRLMNRRYDTSLFASKIDTIRKLIPHAFIGVDIIAGARGETQEEWEKSLQFVESLEISRLHVFPYSERPGTKALQLEEKVSDSDKTQRCDKLISVSDSKLRQFMEKNLGSVRSVLWETKLPNGNLMSGLTDNYLRVRSPYHENMINEIVPTRLLEIDSTRIEMIRGEILSLTPKSVQV